MSLGLSQSGALGTLVLRAKDPSPTVWPPPGISPLWGSEEQTSDLHGQGCEDRMTAWWLRLCCLDPSQHLENSACSASHQHAFSWDRATQGPIITAMIAAGHIY